MRSRYTKVLTVIAACATLASCSSNLNPDLPLNYGDAVVSVQDKDGKSVDVAFNYNRTYYDDVGSINATAVNSILDYVASELSQGHIKDDDGNVMHLYSSVADEDDASTYTVPYIAGVNKDGSFISGSYEYKGIAKEVTQRTQKALLDRVNGGTYDYDSVFDEKQFALSLNSSNLAGIDISKVKNTLDKGVVVNATSDFADVFTAGLYDTFMNKYDAPTIIENMLTAQYIYEERYSSIVNADFRNVSIAALTDRSDKKGSAQALINAYYTDYISQNKTIEAEYADAPLEELTLLWKGIDLTTDQTKFLTDNGLTDDTLMAGIEADISKIHLDNPLLTDSDLQNKYTGNGKYDVAHGKQVQTDAIRKQDLYTEGLKQKSDLSSLPSAVTNQIFSANMSSVLTYPAGKNDDGTNKGHGYITPATTINDPNAASTITIYDSSSDTYYLAMIDTDDIYSSTTLGGKDANRSDAKKRAMAMDVAYNMNADSTYRSDATVYWIEKLVGDGKLVVKNQSFYDYLDSTYPDLFDDDDED